MLPQRDTAIREEGTMEPDKIYQADYAKLLPNRQNTKVLIVDDEQEITEELAELLQDSGFLVQIATEPTNAISMIIDNEDISIVISDLSMPTMTGLEMMERTNELLAGSRDIEFVVVTGNADTKRTIKALKLGALDFIEKPINSEFVIRAITKALEVCRHKRFQKITQRLLRGEVAQLTSKSQRLSGSLKEANLALDLKNADFDAANQVKSEFLSLISHEFRTPLGQIIGFGQLLNMVDVDAKSEKVNDYSNRIVEAGNNLLQKVNTILDFININSSDQPLIRTKFDLLEVISCVCNLFKSKAEIKNIEIIEQIYDYPLFVYADKSRITQAIGNIIDNAIRFSEPDRSLVLEAYPNENSIFISASDQGMGMSEEEVIIAEETFRQVDSSLSKSAYGIGMGLTLSKHIVESHGGLMSIQSAPNEGSVVTISLPRSLPRDGELG